MRDLLIGLMGRRQGLIVSFVSRSHIYKNASRVNLLFYHHLRLHIQSFYCERVLKIIDSLNGNIFKVTDLAPLLCGISSS